MFDMTGTSWNGVSIEDECCGLKEDLAKAMLPTGAGDRQRGPRGGRRETARQRRLRAAGSDDTALSQPTRLGMRTRNRPPVSELSNEISPP